MIEHLAVLGISGFSGSGKTTLLEKLIPRLLERNLRLAVVKHDAHGIQLDKPGKDSYRFFAAGADVLLQGPQEQFLRVRSCDPLEGLMNIEQLATRYDLVLVEGHKNVPLPKIWLAGSDATPPPAGIDNILAVLDWHSDRIASAERIILDFLQAQQRRCPLLGCVLIGGKSSRMGRPKHLIERNGRTFLEQTVELLGRRCNKVLISGAGDIPAAAGNLTRLPDVPNVDGPMSGLLSAMRWDSSASWLVCACDLPDASVEAVDWLLTHRRAGVWAVLPKLSDRDHVEPLFAHYDFRCRWPLERLCASGGRALRGLAELDRVITPSPPHELEPAFRNVNSPADLV